LSGEVFLFLREVLTMFSNRLPSTTALRVFESAVRHGTCTGAAHELCLSQSAVSKQLRSLESALGVHLFQRTSQGLFLTPQGSMYLRTARGVLQQLEGAISAVANDVRHEETLTLKVLQTLGERWLMPRYPLFAAQHPHTHVQFSVHGNSQRTPDGEFRFGTGHWPGSAVSYLFGRSVVLVVSPRMLASHSVTRPQAVFHMPRLVHADVDEHWQTFARQEGACVDHPVRTVRCGYYSLLIQAAVAGMGAALVPRMFVSQELAAGVLVNPLGLALTSRLGYYFVRPAVPAGDSGVALQRFASWLALQCGDGPASVDADVAHLDHTAQGSRVLEDGVAQGFR